jgi:hypothetical protein
MPVRRTAKINRTKTATPNHQSRSRGSPELAAQAAEYGRWQFLEPFPHDPSQPESSQTRDTHAASSGDAVSVQDEPFTSHSQLLAIATNATFADGMGRDTRSSSLARPLAARLELLEPG